MVPFDAFVSLETQVERQRQARESQFQALIDEAQLAFLDFCDFKAREDLQDLTRLCLEALHYQRSRVEPYALLAFAMFCAQSPRLGQKYLKIARSIHPQFPLVQKIQNQLLKGI